MARNNDPEDRSSSEIGRSSTTTPSRGSQAYQKVNEYFAQDLPYLWSDRADVGRRGPPHRSELQQPDHALGRSVPRFPRGPRSGPRRSRLSWGRDPVTWKLEGDVAAHYEQGVERDAWRPGDCSRRSGPGDVRPLSAAATRRCLGRGRRRRRLRPPARPAAATPSTWSTPFRRHRWPPGPLQLRSPELGTAGIRRGRGRQGAPGRRQLRRRRLAARAALPSGRAAATGQRALAEALRCPAPWRADAGGGNLPLRVLLRRLRLGDYADPVFEKIVEDDLREGIHRNPRVADKPEWFTLSYFHTWRRAARRSRRGWVHGRRGAGGGRDRGRFRPQRRPVTTHVHARPCCAPSVGSSGNPASWGPAPTSWRSAPRPGPGPTPPAPPGRQRPTAILGACNTHRLCPDTDEQPDTGGGGRRAHPVLDAHGPRGRGLRDRRGGQRGGRPGPASPPRRPTWP